MRREASLGRALAAGSLACIVSFLSIAAPAADTEPRERQLTPEEIDAWLDSRAMPKSRADGATVDDDAAAPPPPPREHGVVLESSIGVLGHVGHLKNISPSAPWFGVRLGFEPLRWLMVFAETDLAIASTSYAHPPPPPRSFALWSAGAGVRLTFKPLDRFGLFLQGSLGGGRVTTDVLEIYGYPNADRLGFYQSAQLGVEWYQVNPHLALALHGGVRNYPSTLKRDRDNQPPMAWLSGAALRYTF